MASILVQIAGTNGAGKSTALRDLYNSACDIVPVTYKGQEHVISWLRDVGCVVVGNYESFSGGGDMLMARYAPMANVNDIILAAAKHERFVDLPVFFEGLLLASYVNIERLHKALEPHDMPYLVVHCDPPLEVCLGRIYERNNNKPIKEEHVKGRWSSQRNYMPRVRNDGLAQVVHWRNHLYDRDEMLDVFLHIVWLALHGQLPEEI